MKLEFHQYETTIGSQDQSVKSKFRIFVSE